MKIVRPNRGRILQHGNGSGGVTEADVENRARSIASINGEAGAPSAEDYKQARRELTGGDLPDTIEDDRDSDVALTRDPSEPPSDTGHQVMEDEGVDEQKALERLANEGVDEAQHDQMIAARRRERQVDRKGGEV